ncbi:MAG: hypothetical protein GTN36_01415 [Candidatus Aenigmarchaeota archaeon]|nr:hypothetical protein [Candidatus Aenigmarchaeota archaeon]
MDFDFGVHKDLSAKTFELARKLKASFIGTLPVFIEYMPDGCEKKELWDDTKYRIYRFEPRRRDQESYDTENGFGYVSLDSKLLRRDFHKAFQYFSHGVAHSIGFFDDETSSLELRKTLEEMYCEIIGYNALVFSLKNDGDGEKIIEKVKKNCRNRYRAAFEIGKLLEKKKPGFIKNLNSLMCMADESPEQLPRIAIEKKVVKDFLNACWELGMGKVVLEELERDFQKKRKRYDDSDKTYLQEHEFILI